MQSLVQEVGGWTAPERAAARCMGEPGMLLLRSACFQGGSARYSFLVRRPFLSFSSMGSACHLSGHAGSRLQFGNPWSLLEGLVARYEILEELDLPFPLGGCFGFWGYDLRHFVEPALPRTAPVDSDIPDCALGFYSSLLVFDHQLSKIWMVSTGLLPDGSRSMQHAIRERDAWLEFLESPDPGEEPPGGTECGPLESNFTRAQFVEQVERARRYIRAGDIYQVNLAQRFEAPALGGAWDLFQRLCAVSPAPFAAFLQAGEFQLLSSSPELFLRFHGRQVTTRPIKGTRPRSADPVRDAQLAYELQTSGKETAELVMITDLLRNDLGKVCDYGSIQVPELMRLERFAQVHHLVSTVEGRLRSPVSHLSALAACFPGGSITGAPKFRAMQVIEELEPVSRGPYTGCLGYLGFNQESQLSILIRTAVQAGGRIRFHAGAGIVADSDPDAEYAETLAKASGFFSALSASRSRYSPA